MLLRVGGLGQDEYANTSNLRDGWLCGGMHIFAGGDENLSGSSYYVIRALRYPGAWNGVMEWGVWDVNFVALFV